MSDEPEAGTEHPHGWPAPSWPKLFAFGLATRVVIVVAGCLLVLPQNSARNLSSAALASPGMNARHLSALRLGHRPWVEPWYRWDAIWYAEISDRGYWYVPGRESSVAFMPLLPVLMRGGEALGLDRYWVGLVVPNLAFALGMSCFGRCVLLATGSVPQVWRTCLLLVSFPSAFFFSAPYQESLGFALTAAALLAWLTHRPRVSALALGWASAARLTALAMSIGVILEWGRDVYRGRPARRSAWLVALSGSLGTLAFLIYLWWRFGDPFLHFKAHSAWHRVRPSVPRLAVSLWTMARITFRLASTSIPFLVATAALLVWALHGLLRRAWIKSVGMLVNADSADRLVSRRRTRIAMIVALELAALTSLLLLREADSRQRVFSFLRELVVSRDLLAALLFLGLGLHAWWKRGPLWGCLVLVPILLGISSGSLMSMMRIVLSAYPGFLDAAEIGSNRVAYAASLAVCWIAQFILLTLFVNWKFVG